MTLKYIFVFWQFALPGFLYLILFTIMLRCNRIVWAIFPLVSWAILSVPLDWNAVNSSRWALPIFWMHFLLVILSGPQLRRWSVVASLALGAAMWGGLYESVVLQCTLCLGFGALLWWRDKNKVPFLYALASVPGAIRAALSFVGSGHAAPNGFHGFMLSYVFMEPYYMFIILALVLILSFGTTAKLLPRYFYALLVFLLISIGFNIFLNPLPSVWQQEGFKFDYVVLSAGLMVAAGALRVLNAPPTGSSMPAASVALLAGALLWFVQLQQTMNWADCQVAYQTQKGDAPILIDAPLMPLFQANSKLEPVSAGQYNQCVWDWVEPWTDVVIKPDGRITQWPIFSFWQYFAFIEKAGTVYLHTNNWSLTSPTFQADEADLPLKTLLYDMTPLYQRVGLGDLAPRARCMDPERSGSYWHNYLVSLDDAGRRLMFVCPRQN